MYERNELVRSAYKLSVGLKFMVISPIHLSQLTVRSLGSGPIATS
jgi:hypothetical protein